MIFSKKQSYTFYEFNLLKFIKPFFVAKHGLSIPCALEKNVYSAVFNRNVLYMFGRTNLLIV